MLLEGLISLTLAIPGRALPEGDGWTSPGSCSTRPVISDDTGEILYNSPQDGFALGVAAASASPNARPGTGPRRLYPFGDLTSS